ncbi:MAG: hypothetical protein HQK66_10295, partial [Desulfamplus sp.]|nr:hypothetical protein [Desulfamplus sp.]
RVANIDRFSSLSGQKLFSAHWRPVRPNEMELVKPWLDNMLSRHIQDIEA